VRAILSLGVVLALAGCGGVSSSSQPDADATLALGGPPSALHVGVFLALERGFDETEGVDLRLRRGGDPVALLRNGRVQAAILGGPASGVVCVMEFLPGGPYLCVTRTALEDRRSEVSALVRALQRGYSEAAIDPESALQAELAAAPGLDQATLSDQLDAFRGTLEPRPPEDGPGFDGSLVRRTSRD
jgi:ABC-type nitrate/sulfonate/bicarbonate transport system substrate-binding protein